MFVYFLVAAFVSVQCAVVTTTSSTTSFRCGAHEVENPCGIVCEASCTNPRPFCPLRPCIIGAKPVCVCDADNGYVRDKISGKCVKKNQCPKKKCGAHEVPDKCGNPCEPTCMNRTPICPLFCRQGVIVCHCNGAKGWIRDSATGKCVKKGNCPKMPTATTPSGSG